MLKLFPMARHRFLVANSCNMRQHFFKFILGVFIGSFLTHITLRYFGVGSDFNLTFHVKKAMYSSARVTNIEEAGSQSTDNEEQIQHREIADLLGEDALRKWMSSRIRILCWVMTSPHTLHQKASHVKATWARRCNTVLFISSENTNFPSIAVSDHEGREYLFEKTIGAFDYIHKHYIDKADWFLKADDDTYVIVENLRKLLSSYDPDKAIYFGRKYKFPHNTKVIYMQGGAGYVLSRKAVEVLVEKIYKSDFYATYIKRLPSEDLMISKLFMKNKVEEGYSRDGIHEKFHAVSPEETIVPIEHVLTNYSFYAVKQGPECCSDHTISFHYITPDMMYWLEYMVYNFRPFGTGYHACPSDIRSVLGLPGVNETAEASNTNVEVKGIQRKENEGKKRGRREKTY